jgi:microcystin-dependent protein
MTAPAPVPALPDAPRSTPYAVVGAAGPFAVGFAIYGDNSDYTAWVLVTLDGVEQIGNWVLDSPSGSLITLARPITDARITFTAPVTGALVITGAQRPRRLAQNAENRGVTARDFNQTYTALVAMLREAWDKFSRQLLVPPGESATLLPPAAARANQLLGFDSIGSPIAAQPSSALVSSAMQDVVAAASHAAAAALLGAAPATATIPIGMVAMWPGLTVPALWLPRDATTRLRAGFPELLAVLAPTIPATVVNASSAVAVPSTAGWNVGWPVEGPAIAPGTTIAVIPDATHITMSAPAIAAGTAIQVFPYGNGDGVNSFTLPDARGYVDAGLDLGQTRLTNGHQLYANLGQGVVTLTIPQLPIITPAGSVSRPSIANQATGVLTLGGTLAFTLGGGAGNIGVGTLALSVDPVFTGAQFGGNQAHNNVQPTRIYLPIIFAGR